MMIDRMKVELAMADKRLSKGEVAKRMGLRSDGLSSLLRRIKDGTDIQPINARKLADALDVAVESLLPSPNGKCPGVSA